LREDELSRCRLLQVETIFFRVDVGSAQREYSQQMEQRKLMSQKWASNGHGRIGAGITRKPTSFAAACNSIAKYQKHKLSFIDNRVLRNSREHVA
jgi:hypothetical protein